MAIGDFRKHTDFDGTGVDTDAANLALNSSGNAVAIDKSGNVYCVNTSGAVHKYDSSGNLLGTLGAFHSFAPSQLKIMYHPTNGTWLFGVDGPVSGENVQGLCISGGPGAGTYTNTLGMAYGGIYSGGNNASWDVDTNGNVWLFDKDAGGTYVNIPRLLQVGFTGGTGSSTIALLNATDFSVLGWTQAYGILFNPQDNTLLLGGAGPSSISVAKINPSNPSTILASSTTLNGFLPFNIGIDGKYVTRDTLTSLSYVNGNTLTLISNHANSDFGFATSMTFGVYDGKTQKWWVQLNGGGVKCLDMIAITTLATLSDPAANTYYGNPQIVSNGLAVSPGGDLAVTTLVDAGYGFIDLWQGVSPQLSVTPSSLFYNPYGFLVLGSAPPGSAAYNSAQGTQQLIVTNIAGGLSMPFTASTSLAKPARWLIVSPASGDAGSGPVTVNISLNLNGDDIPFSTFGLKDGTFTATITVSAGSAGQINIPIMVQIAKYPSRAGY